MSEKRSESLIDMNDAKRPSPRLLIVDDDPALGKTLQGILSKAGYDGLWVNSGQEALRQLQETGTHIDVALIDLKLPDMSGIDILRAMKRLKTDVGAIMMTGNADIETALVALNEGAFAYILKPYNIDEVKAAIARLVEKQTLVLENRQLLQRMMELNAELENKVKQRTADLQNTNLKLAETIEGLKEADKLKSEFVTMVSHELRTPLTVIIGCTQTLISQLDHLDHATLLKYLHLMDSDAHRLSRLAEEILELSQLERQRLKLKFEPFDVRELIQHVIEGFHFAGGGKQFKLDFKTDNTQMLSDKDRLQQILTNLIGNAVKYTPEEGMIQVIVETEDRNIRLNVIDTGPGIPEDLREKIFEPFFRTQDAVNYKHPGAGLGLTITRALVEALGGRIWLDPKISQGCKFAMTLPREQSIPSPQAEAA